MKKEKKIDFVFDLNKQLRDEIKNSKYIKITMIVVTTVGTLYALGYVFKVLNFTAHNFKNLRTTINS